MKINYTRRIAKVKENDIKKIHRKLEKALDKKRFEHTLGVAYTATALAMRYEEDLKKAEVAGLLHDCAKCIENSKKLAICEKYNIQVSDLERKNPYLLHAKLGGFIAMQKYGVRDKEIVSAIVNHTTGCPHMGQLDKIIYIADYIEPYRHQAPHLKAIRQMAFLDIDKALLMILEDTLKYLNALGNSIDPMTEKTYEYYKNNIQ